MELNYGPNFKDSNKKITVDSKLDRKIKSWKEASLDFVGKVEVGTVSPMFCLFKH